MPVKKLGGASVSVEADTSGFGKGLSAKLAAALKASEAEAKRAGRRIGRQVVDGVGDEIVRRTPELRRRINAMLRGISVTAKVKVDVDVEGGSSSARGLAARLRGQLEGELFGSLKTTSNAVRGLFGGLVPKSLTQVGVAISAISIGGAVLAGAINAAGREMLNLVKLSAFLPAVVSVLAAGAAAVKVGFLGVGEAIEAALSKDPKKLAEALKGLTPSARSFVMEINKAIPVFDRIKAATQESIFRPLRGVVTQIVGMLGPSVTKGMAQVGSAIGSVLASIGTVLANPATAKFLDNLFKSTASIITTLGGPISNLLNALVNAANAALPSLVDLAGGSLGGVIQKFADWINKVVKDGSFQEFLDSAKRTLSEIWDVIKEVALLFGVLFDDADKEGESFLVTVRDLIKAFREFAASPDGQFALRGIGDAAKLAGIAIIGIVGIISVVITAVGSFVSAVRSAIEWVGRLLDRVGLLPGGGSVMKGMRTLPGHADGDIVRRPELATIAEDGPEVIIPLTRPNRARQLAERSGLTKMLGGDGGAVTQVFYLGEERITARMVRIVDTTIARSVADAASGIRPA